MQGLPALPDPPMPNWGDLMARITEATHDENEKAKVYWHAVTNRCSTLDYLRARKAYETARDRTLDLTLLAQSAFDMGMDA